MRFGAAVAFVVSMSQRIHLDCLGVKRYHSFMAKRLAPEVRAYMARLGTKGGKNAAAQMTAAERKARATKASQAAAVARTKKAQGKKDQA